MGNRGHRDRQMDLQVWAIEGIETGRWTYRYGQIGGMETGKPTYMYGH